ncbi:hypothetical protein CLU79DRAFT_720754 [Phycomyces nitens]|nr:hypothetical protein CLU79DRAFT_720754 [Phycomyces nitens]
MLHDSPDDYGPLANTWGSQSRPLADWGALIDPDSTPKSRGIGSGNLHRKGPNFIPVDEKVILNQRLNKGAVAKSNTSSKKAVPKSKEDNNRQPKSQKKQTFGDNKVEPQNTFRNKERKKENTSWKSHIADPLDNSPTISDRSNNHVSSPSTIRPPARGKSSNIDNPWLNTALSEEYFWGIKAATENSPGEIALAPPSAKQPKEEERSTRYSSAPRDPDQPASFSRSSRYSKTSFPKPGPVSNQGQTVFSRTSPAITETQTVYSRTSPTVKSESQTVFSRSSKSNIGPLPPKPIQTTLPPTTATNKTPESASSRFSNPNRQKYSRPAGSYAPVPSNYQLRQAPQPPLRVAAPSLADNPIIIKINVGLGSSNSAAVSIRLLDDPIALAERFIETHKITSSSALQLIVNLFTSQKEMAMKERSTLHR